MNEEIPVRPEWLVDRRQSRSMMMPEFSRKVGETDDRALLADVAFNRHTMNDGHHVSPFDTGKVQIGTDGIEVALVQGINEDAFKRTLSMAVRATLGVDIADGLPGDWQPCPDFKAYMMRHMAEGMSDLLTDKYHECAVHTAHRYRSDVDAGQAFEGQLPLDDWEEMLKGGLQTALETQTIIFAVKGVSRTCTHQLVRSRRASFHQQSQRASFMGDMPECRMPMSVWRKPDARRAFIHAMQQCWRAYQTATECDISYQDARFILPEGTCNFIMLEYPVREFLNVYAYRACSMFQWEIVEVMRQCREELVERHPWLEPYVKISCEKTGPVMANINERSPGGNTATGQVRIADHHCTFQGWEDVEGQCDFPWAKHEARTFKPAHHRITRKET